MANMIDKGINTGRIRATLCRYFLTRFVSESHGFHNLIPPIDLSAGTWYYHPVGRREL